MRSMPKSVFTALSQSASDWANGHMFSYLSRAGKLALRLPPKTAEHSSKNTKPNCVKPTELSSLNTSKSPTRCSPPRGN
jgi:hypothetical protein